ncbi:MAG: hypothetical protein K8S56_08705 [Candidatus Cloacimonetes bacterium]|nr:hypothetical protein [Candidatus Cloacimonadota bacterium]
MLYQPDGGAIASYAASRSTSGPANVYIFGTLLEQCVNERQTLGTASMIAKQSTTGDAKKYILMGDPVLSVVPPQRVASVVYENNPDSLQALQTGVACGNFNNTSLDGATMLRVFDSAIQTSYTAGNTVTWDVPGGTIFRGNKTVENGEFTNVEFIVPYDILGGDKGTFVSYFWDENTEKDYIVYDYPLKIKGHTFQADNPDSPEIHIWLNNRNFIAGDPVGSLPLLIASISDSNGVNILAQPGHKILVRLDNENILTDVTSGFIYDLDSCISGELTWTLENMSEGQHILELIAFDNQNQPSVGTIEFRVVDKADMEEIAIERVVPYPSPYTGSEDFYFTFIITKSADVTIDVYTITGRKIKRISRTGLLEGYNQIFWNVKDGDGDSIANNTYFYKIRAKSLETGKSVETIEKFAVYK